MKYTKETDKGYPRFQLYFDVGFDEFYQIANILEEKMHISFKKKINDFDSLYWLFEYEGRGLTLSYNTFLGVFIYPSLAKGFSREDELAIEKLMEQLGSISD